MKIQVKALDTIGNALTNLNDEPHVKCLIANCGTINSNIDMDELQRLGYIDVIDRQCNINISKFL
jgi:hypothetical protein